jgi:cytochrome c-type biogenesis protein CcsB
MINETFANVSDAMTVAAMAAYTVAMLAFVADLAARSQRAVAPVRVLVPAGAAGRADDLDGPVDPDGPPDADGAMGADGSGGQAAHTGRLAGIATSVFILAAGLHVVAVAARGLSVGRVPWSNAYEFAVTGSMAVAVLAIGLLVRERARWLGAFVTLPVLLTLGVATAVFYTEPTALAPALQSFWLVIHVSVAFIASALFTVGFSLAVLQLVQHRFDAKGGARPGFLRAVPGAADLEALSFRLHAAGFVLWSFTVVAGAIWANHAWGRYWGWDPKEVWSLVIWVVYAGYLHARVTAGWGGARAAWFALFGYACLLFNFFGVNYLFVGNHSYAQ